MAISLAIDIASIGPESTPSRLQRDGVDASLDEPVADIVQSGEGRCDVASSTTPEELGAARSSGPGDGVQVGGGRLLSPEEMLSAQDEMSLGSADVGEWVKGVGVLPGLEGIAPGVTLGEVSDPSSVTTVKVEVVGGGVNDSESGTSHASSVSRADPNHDDGIVGKGHVVGVDHLLPDNGSLSLGLKSSVVGLSESVQSLFEGLSA